MSTHRPVIMASEHAISAGHYLATDAGMSILNAGGNAIDAGVAAGLALGVVQSDLVNVAGVAPTIIWHAATAEIVCIDGLGTWPATVTPDLFERKHGGTIPESLLRTVVPAAPASWLTALERYGTLSFGEIAAPSIRLARDGFAMEPIMADFITSHREGFARWPENRAIYLPNGQPPVVGERFVQRDLAATLQYMVDEESAHAGDGRTSGIRAAYDAFYKGDIARKIADFYRDNGGLLSMEDLASYRVRLEPTVPMRYGGYEVHCCGPWSQGPALAQTLGLLAGIDLATLGHNSPAYIHTVAEALKLAFADREQYFGDPAFVDVPLDGLLGSEYLDARRELIRADRAWPDMPPPGDPLTMAARAGAWTPNQKPHLDHARYADSHDVSPREDAATRSVGDTSYVCVVDREGNCFSATPSDVACESPVVPGTGLAPSSRGSQSRPSPEHPASVAPGKRPRLTPNPALALAEGRPAMVFGTPGGDVQIQAMAQFMVNVATFDMDVQCAIEAPRFATFSFPSSFAPNQSFPGVLAVEGRIPVATENALSALGHDVERWPDWTRGAGAMSAIRIDASNGVLHAGADPRRAAYAMGR